MAQRIPSVQSGHIGVLTHSDHSTSTMAPAEAGLREIVRRIPSVVGRLVWLTRLRDINTGEYHLPGRGKSEPFADQVLRILHDENFRIWFNYRQDQRIADMELYLSGSDRSKAAIVRNWMRLESHRGLSPASASLLERRLFISAFECVLERMTIQFKISSSEAGALGAVHPYLTAKQVAHMISVPVRTIRLWAEVGQIPAIKFGRQWRFQEHDVYTFLKLHNSSSLSP